MSTTIKMFFQSKLVIAILIAVLALIVLAGVLGQQTVSAAGTGPCDIYASGGTPCVAAHSTIRALYGAYSGNLYQVKRASDNATLNIGVLEAGGFANAAAQDTFCAGTTCTIPIIYDQSPQGNHLTPAPAGGICGADSPADASALPLSVGGHNVYGIKISSGIGYRDNTTSGIAINDQPEGMYAVLDATRYNSGCCFDYGNAETNNLDTGNGHMETIYFGNSTVWGYGAGSGPWVMADLENGLFSGVNRGYNSNDPSITGMNYVTAIVKGEPNHWAIRGGNSQSGSLSTYYDGIRPTVSGYNPMHKEGAIILGIGGDNSCSAIGNFFEGAMTSGYPSDSTENSVQSNIVAAGYGNQLPTATPTTFNTPSPQTDPIIWYKMDETSGSTAADSSGNGKNGTLTGGSWVAGHINNALNLNGSTQYVTMPGNIVSNLNDFTVATWVKVTSNSSWARIFDFGINTNTYMFMAPQSGDNTFRYAITNSGNGSEQRIDGTTLSTGTWHHVAVTLVGNTGRLYVDGAQVGSNASMTLHPSGLGNTTANYIGKSQWSDPYLNGQIDDFRVYNRGLSASEILSLYNGTTSPTPTTGPTATRTATSTTGPTPTPTNTQTVSQNPVHDYAFDGNANDSGTNPANGTVTGGTYVTGQNGQAVSLSGSSQYVSFPSGFISSLNDFSIATWVNLNSSSNWNRIFDFGTGTTVNMFLTPQNGATGAIRFAITTSGNSSEQQITGSSALPTGAWHHVAVTKNGNTGTLYVDGSVVGTNNSMTLSPSSLGTTTQNWVGRSQYSGDPYLNGAVDDFLIYDRALSLSEVQALASGGSGPTSTPAPTSTPVPTATPGGSSPTYQAEDALVGGGSTIDTNHTGYNGTGFVNFPTNGGYVEYQNADGGSGGTKTLVFRYALGAASSRTGQLIINGVTQNITFTTTGNWNTWATMNVTVTLNAGTTNTIRLQSTGQDLANQDEMTIN